MGLAPAGSGAAPPEVSAAFLQQLAQAANHKDTAALTSLTAPEVQADYSWAAQPPGMLSRPFPWQVKTLDLPGSDQTRYAVFTKYHPCESNGDHLFPVISTPEGPRLGAEIPEYETGGYRVRDHKLVVHFDVPHPVVHIRDHVTVERQENSLPAAVLRINAIYTVDSVKQDGAPVPFHQSGGFLAIQPPAQDRASYDLAYHTTLASGTDDYILPNQAALTSYWYPHTGRLPATSEVRITVPRGWTAIGQGDPAGKSVERGETTYRWKNTLPVSFLTVAAGKFTVTTQNVNGMPIAAYLIHPSAARARQAISTAAGAIQWFSSHFSRFPYSRYAVVETDQFPAALECYSFTLVGRMLIPIAEVHEISHTWWGGIMPNTYTRSMWNESFAEYSDGLYGRITGAPGIHEFNPKVVTMPQLGALLGKTSLLHAHDAMDMAESAIGYGKGSLVLENLERMLGTDRMLACMRRFIQSHKLGEDAEWQDFEDAVAAVAGPEWTAYFGPWLSRTDFPRLRLEDTRVERQGSRFIVTGTVTQTEPAFWVHVPLVVQTNAGSVKSAVDVKGSSAPFRIETTGRPTTVLLDPNREALRAPSPDGDQVKLALASN